MRHTFCTQAILALSFMIIAPAITVAGDQTTGPQIELPQGESLPSGVVNTPYPFFRFKGTGGTEPYKWEVGTDKLPDGLTLDNKTGRILGVPTKDVPQKPVDVKLTDNASKSTEQRYFISVFKDQASKDADINAICFRDSQAGGEIGDLGHNWSLGPTVTTQLIRYNFNDKQASFNAKGLGVGAAFRFYADNDMKAAPGSGEKDIRRIKPECRATTFSSFQSNSEKAKASATFSITPTVFAFYDSTQNGSSGQGQLNVQPAILIGLWRDLINVGVGWNMAGQNRGQAFLLMGIGTGFSF